MSILGLNVIGGTYLFRKCDNACGIRMFLEKPTEFRQETKVEATFVRCCLYKI